MQDKLGEPFYLGVEEVKEHEDGSATYTFHMDDNASKHLTELGLKLVLYCGVASVDVADVYDWILAQAPKEPEARLPEGRTPLSDDWFREKAAAFNFDEYGFYGENNGPLPPTKDIRPMTDEERQRATEKGKANGYK
jgi:hypothetical protein